MATKPTRISKGERYAMNENSNIVRLRQQGEINDPLTDILRSGARQLLAQAVEMKAEAFLAAMKDLKLPDGRDRLVPHGHCPVRAIQTGIGSVDISRVKIAIAAPPAMANGYASPRRSCRGDRVGRRA